MGRALQWLRCFVFFFVLGFIIVVFFMMKYIVFGVGVFSSELRENTFCITTCTLYRDCCFGFALLVHSRNRCPCSYYALTFLIADFLKTLKRRQFLSVIKRKSSVFFTEGKKNYIQYVTLTTHSPLIIVR